MSTAEEILAFHLRANGIEFIREYRFAAEHVGTAPGVRQRLVAAGLQDWRADFCIPTHSLLIECEGGGWTGGRHTRGAGFSADLAKYDAAMRLGYNVYRCSPEMIKIGRAIETIQELLKLKQEVNREHHMRLLPIFDVSGTERIALGAGVHPRAD